MKDLMDRTPEELTAQAVANGQHPRTLLVAAAKAAMAHAVCVVAKKYELTDIETLQCVNETASGVLKYALRVERHGDSEYPADSPPATRRRRGKIVHRDGDPLDSRGANRGMQS